MSIYSNDNIRKIAKLTTRELPQKSKNVKITVRENNGLYSTYERHDTVIDPRLCNNFYCVDTWLRYGDVIHLLGDCSC